MKVVCIDDTTDILGFGNGEKELTFGKTYLVNWEYITTDGRLFYHIINDLGKGVEYLSTRFIKPEEFREKKLTELGIK